MTAREKKYWIAFSCFTPIGPKRFNLLLKHFGSAEKAWGSSREELQKIGFKEKLVSDFLNFRDSFNLSSYFLRLEKLGINSILLEDKTYPKNLRRIDGAPFLLYTFGEVLPKDELAIGVVGTRKVTGYGRQVTEGLVADLVASGLTIISGLAYGVDYLAHTTALSLGGRTIGVWAGGLDTLTDGFRKNLVEKIISSKKGAIISEYPLGFQPMRITFPQRNRIISGLSLGVLVTEAALDSGSLITAQCAKKQGRKVFAVPGPITSSMSAGTANLIKSGASFVYNVKDILDELDVSVKKKNLQIRMVLPENPQEAKIIEALKNESKNIDEIVRITGLKVSKAAGILSLMEMKGKVKNLGGSVYTLCN